MKLRHKDESTGQSKIFRHCLFTICKFIILTFDDQFDGSVCFNVSFFLQGTSHLLLNKMYEYKKTFKKDRLKLKSDQTKLLLNVQYI